MKILKWSAASVSNFILMLSLVSHPPAAMAQSKTSSVQSDRLDTLDEVATEIYRSKDAMRVYYELVSQSQRDPELKRAMQLEEKLIESQRKIDEKKAHIDIIKKSNRKTLEQKNSEITQLKKQVAQLEAEQARLKKSKKALYAAKIAGAALTTISLYFQIKNIQDSLKRVEIKQRDLVSRKNSLVTDKAKLQVLEGKVADCKSQLSNTQSRANVSASEITKGQKLLQDAKIELAQWKDVVQRSQQKILDAEETARIDQRAITRQRWSVGITAIGTLVIGLFGDKIILSIQEWMESDDPSDQVNEAYAYIKEWNVIKPKVVQASLLPSLRKADLTVREKSALFFMTSEEMGLKAGVMDQALQRYKQNYPKSYASLMSTAKSLLRNQLYRSFEFNYWEMVFDQMEKRKADQQNSLPKAIIRDNTNVVTPRIYPKSNYPSPH